MSRITTMQTKRHPPYKHRVVRTVADTTVSLSTFGMTCERLHGKQKHDRTNEHHSARPALLPEDSRIRRRLIEGRGGHHTSSEVAETGRICRGDGCLVRARITLALQLHVRLFAERTYARPPGAAACVQVVPFAVPAPKLRGFSPTRAEGAHQPAGTNACRC